jgi:hypothetical protein
MSRTRPKSVRELTTSPQLGTRTKILDDKKFSSAVEFLRNKLVNALSENAKKILVLQKLDNQKSEYEELMELLTTMKESYLNQDWRRSLVLQETIIRSNKFHGFFRNEKEYKVNSYRFEQVMMYNNLRIYLVLVEWRDYEKIRLSLDDFEPIMESMKVQGKSTQILLKYVIMIGNWMFDWNESGILIPKRLTNELMTLMTKNARSYTIEKESDAVMATVNQVVDEFNLNVDYSKDKNSQHFNHVLMTRLGVEIPAFASGKFFIFKKLKDHSYFEMSYEADDVEYMTKFRLKRKHYFSCHKEFDHFVNQKFLLVDPKFPQNYPEDNDLFIEFERIYRFRCMEKNFDKFEPSLKCPYNKTLF